MAIKIIRKMHALSQTWVCLRCGTTNRNSAQKCEECGNRRPR